MKEGVHAKRYCCQLMNHAIRSENEGGSESELQRMSFFVECTNLY